MNKRVLLVVFIVLLMGVQPAVNALALGELELKSYLNQPLSVVIPLFSLQAGELDELQLGFDRNEEGVHARHDLQVEIVNNAGGPPYLKISSKNSIREPVLSFILDLRWSTGRIKRSYSLLLDIKP